MAERSGAIGYDTLIISLEIGQKNTICAETYVLDAYGRYRIFHKTTFLKLKILRIFVFIHHGQILVWFGVIERFKIQKNAQNDVFRQ